MFDAFTFAFEETEWGWFQAHAYRFNDYTSTFIVETTHDTWKRAGMEHADEDQTIAYLSELFNEELAGWDQLYDLADDPMAQRDLAAREPERVARLPALGLRGMRENQPVPGAGRPPRMKIDRKTLEQLGALGYGR